MTNNKKNIFYGKIKSDNHTHNHISDSNNNHIIQSVLSTTVSYDLHDISTYMYILYLDCSSLLVKLLLNI